MKVLKYIVLTPLFLTVLVFWIGMVITNTTNRSITDVARFIYNDLI